MQAAAAALMSLLPAGLEPGGGSARAGLAMSAGESAGSPPAGQSPGDTVGFAEALAAALSPSSSAPAVPSPSALATGDPSKPGDTAPVQTGQTGTAVLPSIAPAGAGGQILIPSALLLGGQPIASSAGASPGVASASSKPTKEETAPAEELLSTPASPAAGDPTLESPLLALAAALAGAPATASDAGSSDAAPTAVKSAKAQPTPALTLATGAAAPALDAASGLATAPADLLAGQTAAQPPSAANAFAQTTPAVMAITGRSFAPSGFRGLVETPAAAVAAASQAAAAEPAVVAAGGQTASGPEAAAMPARPAALVGAPRAAASPSAEPQPSSPLAAPIQASPPSAPATAQASGMDAQGAAGPEQTAAAALAAARASTAQAARAGAASGPQVAASMPTAKTAAGPASVATPGRSSVTTDALARPGGAQESIAAPADPTRHDPQDGGADQEAEEPAANGQAAVRAEAQATAQGAAPTSATLVPASAGAQPSVLSQTVSRLAADMVKKIQAKASRFDLALDPAGLGRVDVKVRIGADGAVTAALSFDSPASAEALKSRSGELRAALEQAGFNLSGSSLSFTAGGSSDGGAPARDWARSGFASAGEAADTIDATLSASPSTGAWSGQGAVDIRI